MTQTTSPAGRTATAQTQLDTMWKAANTTGQSLSDICRQHPDTMTDREISDLFNSYMRAGGFNAR